MKLTSIFLSLIGISAAQFTFAQALPAPIPEPCVKDRAYFCSNTTAPNDVLSCLAANADKLSTECKQAGERFLQGRSQAENRGGGALSSFGGLNAMGPPVPLISYDFRQYPGTDSPSTTENRANLSTPIYGSKSGVLALSLAGSRLHFGEPITLSNGRVLSQDLFRNELGLQYFAPLPEKKNWGLRASVGYAGDKTADPASDMSFSFSATYGFPGEGDSRWIWMLFFSNNSALGNFIPIPGILYIHRTSTFTGLFGFPIASMQWTPSYPWSYSLSFFGPTIQSEAAYGGLRDTQIFASANWTQQTYIPDEKIDKKDRLTLEEKKISVGFRTVIFEKLMGELQIGHSSDRRIYIGQGLFNMRGGWTELKPDQNLSVTLKTKLF